MKVLIAAGGTGGHLFPGIALARELRKNGCDLLFVGTSRGMEREVLEQEGFPLRTLSIRGFRRLEDRKIGRAMKTAIFNLQSGILLLLSLVQSLWVLLRERPHVAVGMGGSLSFPILFLAWLLRKPTLISEQNFLPGQATQILSFFIDEIHLSFEGSRSFLRRKKRVFVSGNPIRREIAESSIHPELDSGPASRIKTVFIFGGSRGARSINRAFLESLPFIQNREMDIRSSEINISRSAFGIRFILQTGKGEFREIKERLKNYKMQDSDLQSSIFKYSNLQINVYPFIQDMARAYREADLVVSRSGATTCAEITAVGLPVLLIPYPYATEGHQKANAQFLKERGAAEVIQNGELTGERLANTILTLLQDENRLQEMGRRSKSLGRPDAAQRIAERVVKLLNSRIVES